MLEYDILEILVLLGRYRTQYSLWLQVLCAMLEYDILESLVLLGRYKTQYSL